MKGEPSERGSVTSEADEEQDGMADGMRGKAWVGQVLTIAHKYLTESGSWEEDLFWFI